MGYLCIPLIARDLSQVGMVGRGDTGGYAAGAQEILSLLGLVYSKTNGIT
jgi:hypothetical protein